jgi:hypothetical protein
VGLEGPNSFDDRFGPSPVGDNLRAVASLPQPAGEVSHTQVVLGFESDQNDPGAASARERAG